MAAAAPIRQQVQLCIGKAGLSVGSLIYVRQGRREHCAFAYDAAWLANPARFNVSADLQLMPGHQPHKAASPHDSVFHGAIADTAPDAWGRRIIARGHAKRRRADPELPALTEMDYLLAVDDFSRVGALRLRDADGSWHRAAAKGQRNTPPLIELERIYQASRAVERGQESAEDLRYLQGKGTSLGGMRPKCTMVDEDGWLAIGKFPSVGDTRSVTRGEVLALRLAAAAGIDAAPARIVDVRQLWRRLVLNLLITNVDDHLQNHGFLHVEHGLWRLAPAFDINPFPDKDRESKTWLTEQDGPITDVQMLLARASYFALDEARALAVLGEVYAAVSSWRQVALSPEVGLRTVELDDFAPAFEHKQMDAAAALLGR